MAIQDYMLERLNLAHAIVVNHLEHTGFANENRRQETITVRCVLEEAIRYVQGQQVIMGPSMAEVAASALKETCKHTIGEPLSAEAIKRAYDVLNEAWQVAIAAMPTPQYYYACANCGAGWLSTPKPAIENPGCCDKPDLRLVKET